MSELPIESIQQGKTVIERQTDGSYLIMHPNGAVVGASTKTVAERIARKWYKSALTDDGHKVGIGEIEWRI